MRVQHVHDSFAQSSYEKVFFAYLRINLGLGLANMGVFRLFRIFQNIRNNPEKKILMCFNL